MQLIHTFNWGGYYKDEGATYSFYKKTFPKILARRVYHIPVFSIISMAVFAFLLVLSGSLEVILEFGSVTFLLVSLLMAFANYKIRDLTNSSLFITIVSILGLLSGAALIFYYEYSTQPQQLLFIIFLYTILTIASWLFSRRQINQVGN